MGTNYYLQVNYCLSCGRGDALHIGKSSQGWAFALHVYPKNDICDGLTDETMGALEVSGIESWSEWKSLITAPGAVITDEYGNTIAGADMVNRITDRGGLRGLRSHAEVDRTAKRGLGTYDYCKGDFS